MVSDAAACLPDGAVTLESPSKAKLPNAVPPPDAACMLQIGQDVPGRQACLEACAAQLDFLPSLQLCCREPFA